MLRFGKAITEIYKVLRPENKATKNLNKTMSSDNFKSTKRNHLDEV